MLTCNKTSLLLAPSQMLKTSKSSEFHYVWLRDNCGCAECVHPDTKERILVTHTITEDIAPEKVEVVEDRLSIIWNQDKHQSEYSLAWLAAHNYSHASGDFDTSSFESGTAKSNLKLWGSEFQNSLPNFDYQDIRNDPKVLLEWCEVLRDYGLVIVRGAPQVEGEIERFASFVAVVRETIYDRLHNVRATPGEYNAYNVASTTLELKPHTDMPNYNNPPGVQMFHFLANESQGGNSTAVDGFNVARQLKELDSDAYHLLTITPMRFRMFSSRGDVESSNPLLTLDTEGKLKVFRYSNQLAQPVNLPVDQMERFYHAYRMLGRIVEDPENMVEFHLSAGDMMITNNLRIMHGRKSFDLSTGDRHLQLSYMDMDDVLSRIRMIKKSQMV